MVFHSGEKRQPVSSAKWATLWGAADEWCISVTAGPEQEASLYSGRDYKGKAGKLIACCDFSSLVSQAVSVRWLRRHGVTCTVAAWISTARLTQLGQLCYPSTQLKLRGAWVGWRKARQIP